MLECLFYKLQASEWQNYVQKTSAKIFSFEYCQVLGTVAPFVEEWLGL